MRFRCSDGRNVVRVRVPDRAIGAGLCLRGVLDVAPIRGTHVRGLLARGRAAVTVNTISSRVR